MANKIREIMHQHTFVQGGMVIKDVAALMSKKRIGSVLIKTDKGVGILTERDITGKIVAAAKDPKKVSAEDIMTCPAKTIDADADIYEACKLFSENNFRRLPVVEKGQIVGVVTTRDIVRQFVPQLIKDVYHFKDFRF